VRIPEQVVHDSAEVAHLMDAAEPEVLPDLGSTTKKTSRRLFDPRGLSQFIGCTSVSASRCREDAKFISFNSDIRILPEYIEWETGLAGALYPE